MFYSFVRTQQHGKSTEWDADQDYFLRMIEIFFTNDHKNFFGNDQNFFLRMIKNFLGIIEIFFCERSK